MGQDAAMKTMPEETKDPLRPGDADLYYALATAFGTGFAVERDLPRAVRYLEKAAALHHPAATYFLGYCSSEGLGMPRRNHKKAFRCFAEAAKLGVVEGVTGMAWCFSHGEGVKRDKAKAFRLYREAAKKGDALAQYNLGCFFSKGMGGCQKDLKEAFKWYLAAAQKGYPPAQHQTGCCCAGGRGVGKNPRRAVFWYRKAAAQGEEDAIWNLAVCFETGTGVRRNPAKAKELFASLEKKPSPRKP